jgi:hypothetical protein
MMILDIGHARPANPAHPALQHPIVSFNRVWSTGSVATTFVNLENPDLAVVKHPTAFPLLD